MCCCGLETTLWFDALGHLYERAYSGTGGSRTEHFLFDRSGRLTGATRDGVLKPLHGYEWTRSYDELGRPTEEVQRVAVDDVVTAAYTTLFSYAIDTGENTTSWTMTTPNGRQVVHTLDRLNRLVEASMGANIGASWMYNGAGQREAATLGNGVTSLFSYDEAGRLNEITHSATIGGNPVDLFKMQYGHDAVGNRMYSRNNVLTDRSERYGYDNLNRLTLMDRGVLSIDGTTVDPPLDHPVLNVSQQWADLDRRGNWPLTRRAAEPR